MRTTRGNCCGGIDAPEGRPHLGCSAYLGCGALSLNILVLARFVPEALVQGGARRFMYCLADTLKELGHMVTTAGFDEACHLLLWGDRTYDVILCCQPEMMVVADNLHGKKVFISHGCIPDERLRLGADRYVSISEEVRKWNLEGGVDSYVIGQPVKIQKQILPNKDLKKILVLRHYPGTKDLFSFLSEKYDLRYSDPCIPIEEQIAWADLCITLGRGAIEAMAQGKLVLVADNRPYNGAIGDGYLSWGNIAEAAKCNFSGRRYRFPITPEWVESEITKYNLEDSYFLHQYTQTHHEARKVANDYLQLIRGNT